MWRECGANAAVSASAFLAGPYGWRAFGLGPLSTRDIIASADFSVSPPSLLLPRPLLPQAAVAAARGVAAEAAEALNAAKAEAREQQQARAGILRSSLGSPSHPPFAPAAEPNPHSHPASSPLSAEGRRRGRRGRGRVRRPRGRRAGLDPRIGRRARAGRREPHPGDRQVAAPDRRVGSGVGLPALREPGARPLARASLLLRLAPGRPRVKTGLPLFLLVSV